MEFKQTRLTYKKCILFFISELLLFTSNMADEKKMKNKKNKRRHSYRCFLKYFRTDWNTVMFQETRRMLKFFFLFYFSRDITFGV